MAKQVNAFTGAVSNYIDNKWKIGNDNRLFVMVEKTVEPQKILQRYLGGVIQCNFSRKFKNAVNVDTPAFAMKVVKDKEYHQYVLAEQNFSSTASCGAYSPPDLAVVKKLRQTKKSPGQWLKQLLTDQGMKEDTTELSDNDNTDVSWSSTIQDPNISWDYKESLDVDEDPQQILGTPTPSPRNPGYIDHLLCDSQPTATSQSSGMSGADVAAQKKALAQYERTGTFELCCNLCCCF